MCQKKLLESVSRYCECHLWWFTRGLWPWRASGNSRKGYVIFFFHLFQMKPTRCTLLLSNIYFKFSTCFGQLCAHHQENWLYLCDTVIFKLYGWLSGLLQQTRQLPVVSVTFTTGSSNGLINARYCRYSDMSSWWWVEIPPETCRAVCRYK